MKKEIFKEEMLNNAQMEKINGGNIYQTAGDSTFLHNLANLCKSYNSWEIFWGDNGGWSKWDQVRDAWAAVGVKCVVSAGSNEYYIDGKEVSHDAAREYAAQKYGKHWKDFDYGTINF